MADHDNDDAPASYYYPARDLAEHLTYYVDVEHAANLDKLRANYVECAARHDHAWRHGSEDDRRAAYTARLDAADAFVAALDASGDQVT